MCELIDSLLGKKVTFFKDKPPESDDGLLDYFKYPRLRGTVVAAERKEPYGEGKIPDLWVTIEGESGARVTVSCVERFVITAKNQNHE